MVLVFQLFQFSCCVCSCFQGPRVRCRCVSHALRCVFAKARALDALFEIVRLGIAALGTVGGKVEEACIARRIAGGRQCAVLQCLSLEYQITLHAVGRYAPFKRGAARRLQSVGSQIR
jgi:hypothetical protein